MIRVLLKKLFGLREGEIKIALLMQSYIFLIIATLLIIKPTINSIFISKVGIENLPFGYLLVAFTAILSSYFYSRASERFSLKTIIRFTLIFTVIGLISLGFLLHMSLMEKWILYIFYTGVAIYGVLATSQFWVLANLVYNVREAKRVFSFIGTGAIIGGIFGGYLTTILAPIIGNENLVFIAGLFLIFCIPLSNYIWKIKIENLNLFKQKKRITDEKGSPLKLIWASKHLKYLALVIGIGVITAKLVEYQFSYVALLKFPDSDELTAFFGFWFSSFTLISLFIQLFVTNKVVGVWGVGVSLLILPLLIVSGAVLFLIFPELWVVIFLRGVDASLKQSLNKSAIELMTLPIPFQIKKKTKSFIDVVVDSVATGIAGFLLIFFVKGLDVAPVYIMFLIIGLTLVWGYVVYKLRIQYFLSFKNNLQAIVKTDRKIKPIVSKESFLSGMLRVLQEGNEREILYMLNKTLEINDERLLEPISKLLDHPSKAVKLAVIQNLYFIDSKSIHLEVKTYLNSNDKELVIATLEYLLQHADQNEEIIFEKYLNSENVFISNAALICLAKETRDNPKLRQIYNLESRIEEKIDSLSSNDHESLKDMLQIIGYAEYKNRYDLIFTALTGTESDLQKEAIEAASHTMDSKFIDPLLEKLTDKKFRDITKHSLLFYGKGLIPVVFNKMKDKNISIEVRNMIPRIIEAFSSQQAVDALIDAFIGSDELSVRLESVSCLTRLKEKDLGLDFKQNIIANLILEECKLYNSTIDAMHTQIIIHYLRRKKLKFEDEQMSARKSLLEILERRLDNGLKRIFKLLELRFPQNDIRMAYNGITSGEAEDVVNAIEFLDMILNPDLKSVLIPIVEASALDIASEELIDTIGKNRITEYDCFKNILQGKDTKLKIAVLFLIPKTQDQNYLELLLNLQIKADSKLKAFVDKAISELQTKN